jgi:hypothetical protein
LPSLRSPMPALSASYCLLPDDKGCLYFFHSIFIRSLPRLGKWWVSGRCADIYIFVQGMVVGQACRRFNATMHASSLRPLNSRCLTDHTKKKKKLRSSKAERTSQKGPILVGTRTEVRSGRVPRVHTRSDRFPCLIICSISKYV